MNPYLYTPQSKTELPALYANAGGPARRRFKQIINSSILGKNDGFVRCPRIISLGLIFTVGEDPVTVITDILKQEGFFSPEELREKFSLPEGRLLCRPVEASLRHGGCLVVKTADRNKVLEQALMLGLCTNQLFNPARPVLWTETSLTRVVELFDPAGFYK